MSRNESRKKDDRKVPGTSGASSLCDDNLRHQRIAEKAYWLYEARGCCHGHDLEDWLEAERFISAEQEPEPKA